MSASANALGRVGAEDSNIERRVLVGPLRGNVVLAEYLNGEPVTLPSETYTVQAIDFSRLVVGGTLEVEDTSGYSNAGGMFCISSETGETWVRYQSTSGNEFETVTKVGGVDRHPAGAALVQWFDITDRVSLSDIRREQDKVGIWRDWRWQISGERYNSDFMRKDCSVLILESVRPDGDPRKWTEWYVAGLGYVRGWIRTGDSRRLRKWKARVESVLTYVKSRRGAGRNFGRDNLAFQRPAVGSPNLLNALAEPNEWIGGVIGTTTVDKITNGLIGDGPYIAQVASSQTPETPGSSGGADPGLLVEEFFIDGNYWWVQMRLAEDSPHYNEDGQGLDDFAITTKQTVFVRSYGSYPDNHPDHPGDDWPKEIRPATSTEPGAQHYIRLLGIRVTENSDRFILTNDRARFLRRENVGSRLPAYDVREMPGFGDDGYAGAAIVLDREEDWFQLRYCRGIQTVRNMAVIGNTHTGTPWWNSTTDAYESDSQWSGAGIPTPAEGSSNRRSPVSTNTGKDNTDWIEEDDPNPADRRTDTDPAYVAVSLAPIPTALSEGITNVSPAVGELFPITNPGYLWMEDPVGIGLYVDVKVDSEELRLRPNPDGTWKVGIRPINGTTAASHSADALVSQYNSGLDDYTRMPYVQAVEIRRSERFKSYVDADGNTVFDPDVPHVWEWWGSELDEDTPRYPGESFYRLDWIGGAHLVRNLPGDDPSPFRQIADLGRPRPLAHVMPIVRRMMVDNTRVKIDELKAWRAGLDGGAAYPGIGGVVWHYLRQEMEEDDILIDEDCFDQTSGDVPITGGSVGTILEGLGMTYGFTIRATFDNKVEVKRDPMHPLAPVPELFAVMGPDKIRGRVNPQQIDDPSKVGIGQIVVRINDRDAGAVYEGRFPPRAGPYGDIEIEEMEALGGSVEMATRWAQMLYLNDSRISLQIEFTTVGPFPELQEGHRLLVFDYSDDAYNEGRWIDCVVLSVEGTSTTGVRVRAQERRQG